MKPLGKDEQPRGESVELQPTTLSSNPYSKMTLLSFIMSFATLCAVLYSFYAIPAKVESERLGRVEELQAVSELVDSVNDLTQVAIEMTNARRTNPTGNTR